jgi:septal ring factor EnvC (AmiA/AmiB activator)
MNKMESFQTPQERIDEMIKEIRRILVVQGVADAEAKIKKIEDTISDIKHTLQERGADVNEINNELSIIEANIDTKNLPFNVETPIGYLGWKLEEVKKFKKENIAA